MGALLVLLFHASGLFASEKYWNTEIASGVFGFGFAGVEFFFVLSGFIMMHIHRKDVSHPDVIPSYLKKRAVRVYPMYWIVCIGVMPMVLWGGGDVSRIYNSILLVGANNEAVLGVAWTLFHEIAFYVLFATLIASRRVGMLVIAIWFVLCMVWFNREPPHYIFSSVNLLFGVGMLAASLLPKMPRSPALFALGTVGFFVIGLEYVYVDALTEDWREIAFGVSAALAITAGVKLEQEGLLTVPKWISGLGDSSYTLYLVHYPALSMMAHICFATPLRHVPVVVLFPAFIVACLALGHLVHLIIEKPLLKRLQVRRSATRGTASPA